MLLGPGVNIKRSPLCGRNFEYFSEDPYLAGQLAAAFIQGVQRTSVAACVKHFAANSQENRRKAVNSILEERTLREIYLPAFEQAVQAGVKAVMTSYNKVNGEYPAQNRHLSKEILRGEWGFQGVLVTDWGAMDRVVPSIQAGLDLQMPGDDGSSAAKIEAAVKCGELSQEDLGRQRRKNPSAYCMAERAGKETACRNSDSTSGACAGRQNCERVYCPFEKPGEHPSA